METTRLGVLVDRTDPSAIAKGLTTVLADADGRRRVAEAAPEAVREVFSLEQIGEKLWELYDRSLSTASSHEG